MAAKKHSKGKDGARKRQAAAFDGRLEARQGEIERLLDQLYGDDAVGERLVRVLRDAFEARRATLRALDERRAADPYWYRSQNLVGMELYPARFAQTLESFRAHLDYFDELGVNVLYLIAVLDCPPGADDGGYAVADYRRVQPELGTMADLEALCDDCAARGIDICLDLALNHTSDRHAWAKAARAGDQEARARYFMYESWAIPDQFDQLVPEVFPLNAPGNFTELDDGQVVMTTFYPYMWDLNYANPAVLLSMVDNLLFLANRGASILRLNTLPYLWKELGTTCRNLPQVHSLVRLMRLAVECVCPGVVLLGEVVDAPMQVFPYFGRPSAPECHLLYNVTAMATAWHTVATQDARLLERSAGQLAQLGPGCAFENYIRCHDDIGWGLDYPALAEQGMQETPHKRYLNEWFTGQWPGSWSRGELYNAEPDLSDGRLCGTTASLCGIEAAVYADDDGLLERSLRRVVMLHGWLLAQSGIPMLYSGDEIAALNDYAYHDDPEKANDSRYLQRPDFSWAAAQRRNDDRRVEGVVFTVLRRMIACRQAEPAFREDAAVEVANFDAKGVYGLIRRWGDDTVAAVFNFSDGDAVLDVPAGTYSNLLSGVTLEGDRAHPLGAWDFLWLKRLP